MLEPLVAARRLLPSEQLVAAGVFGVQDRALAAGLMGAQVSSLRTAALVRVPADSVTPQLQQAAQWVPVPVLVAVSPLHLHVCRWDQWHGSDAELTRFTRSVAQIEVEAYRAGRRLVVVDQPSGYRLALTGTVSRFNAYASGVRAVLTALE